MARRTVFVVIERKNSNIDGKMADEIHFPRLVILSLLQRWNIEDLTKTVIVTRQLVPTSTIAKATKSVHVTFELLKAARHSFEFTSKS